MKDPHSIHRQLVSLLRIVTMFQYSILRLAVVEVDWVLELS